MDEVFSTYEEARDRLIGDLADTEARIDEVLEKVRALTTAEELQTEKSARSLGTDLNLLDGQRPKLLKPLAGNSALAAAASPQVMVLVEILEKARKKADVLDNVPSPGSVGAMQAAARATVSQLEAARKPLLELLLAYRLKQKLSGLRVGRALDFKATYSASLPTAEERAAALTEFAGWNDYFPQAVFDVGAEKVWRRSGSYAWRLATCAIPFVVALILGGVLALVGVAPWGPETNLDDSGDLVIAYGLVLAGVAAHLIVENIKQSQAERAPITAVGEWVDWVHLRWASLCWSLAPVLVVTIGLLLVGTEVKAEELALFFFAGYSVDSVAGTFLTRFGTAKTSGIKAAEQQAGGP